MTIQGYILIDVDVAALNNAGKKTESNYENAVGTKKVYKNGHSYVYASGQAWRYWWRETLQNNFQWEVSPIDREKKIAYTQANPFRYPDDDLFGYMRAAKEVELDKKGEPLLDSKGKEKKKDVTVTRVSPLKNSALISVNPVRPSEHWSSMSRHVGDAVPYVKDEYSAIMKGMFSIDVEQAGTFSNYQRTGYKNIHEELRKEMLKNGAAEIDDPHYAKAKLVRLPRDVREKRVKDTLEALKIISGGAMQTSNMADVTPKFVILCQFATGNHPFSHIVIPNPKNENEVYFNIEGFREVLKDYANQFQGKIYVGRRSGFCDDWQENLNQLSGEFKNIELLSVNEAIDAFVKEFKL